MTMRAGIIPYGMHKTPVKKEIRWLITDSCEIISSMGMIADVLIKYSRIATIQANRYRLPDSRMPIHTYNNVALQETMRCLPYKTVRYLFGIVPEIPIAAASERLCHLLIIRTTFTTIY